MSSQPEQTPQNPPAQSQAPAPENASATGAPSQSSKQHNAQGSHGKPYHNKQGSGPHAYGSDSGAGRQGYQGQNANNKYYNNKRNNYNQKVNHNKQYSGYTFTPNMYNGNYYYAYPYAQGMMPAMNDMPAYNPQSPQPAHTPLQPYTGSPSISKVKITDKEGKQVDLEEKTKSSTPSSASTPVPTPSQLVQNASEPAASPVNASASPASTTSASTPTPAASSAKSAAEEFKRRILEKAELAKKKKLEEAAKADAEVKAKADAEAKAKAEAESKAKAEAEREAAAAAAAAAPALVEEAPEATQPASEPVEPVSEPVSEPVEAKEPVESAPEPETPAAKAPLEEDAPAQEPVSESKVEDDDAEAEEDDDVEEEGDEPQALDEQDEEADANAEPVFDLSAFISKVNTAEAIEDPFTFEYPYPFTSVDRRWKAGMKKYRYDPQFMLQFREAIQYPIDETWKEKLEGLGIVPNKRSGSGPQRMNSNKFNQMQGGRFNGALPNRLGQYDGRQNSRSGSKRRGGSSAGGRDKSIRNRNQSKRGRDSKDKEDDKPAEEVAPLVPSANRWVPRSRVKKEEVKLAPDGSVMLEPEDVERKTKSALNKLTLEMFEPITDELLAITNQSRWEENAQTIKQVISLTFAKACDEPYWSTVYAQFCAKMLKVIPEEIKDVNILTKSGEPATGGDLARRILLATCQSEYEKGWVDKLPTNEDGSPLEPEMMSDEYYAMAAAKRRGLGLVKFIGNLYILNMLNDQVILHCLRDQSKNTVDPSEDSLENLAQLVKTVGPRFESSERNKAVMNLVYDNVQQILDNCKLSSRIKFMLMDLVDLRKSNWKSMKQESGPKTIKEIHNEAELKRIEENRASAEKRRQNKGNYNNSNYGGNDSRSNSTRQGSSWGNKKDSRAPTKDSRGFTSVSRQQSSRVGQEAPAAASHMSPRENSKRTDSMASNIFAALGGDNEDEESEAHAN